MNHITISTTLLLATLAAPAAGQDGAPSGSLMARAMAAQGAAASNAGAGTGAAGNGGAYSLFRVAVPEPRRFQKHDLIQIIVRESSTARSEHELETDKDFKIGGAINAWPNLQLAELLQLQLQASENASPPKVDIRMSKNFAGEGEYERRDDLTARLSAEVIEVLPNGNLILEARTALRNDDEESVITVTGICRPDDVSAANTVLSNQIHDLKVAKTNTGELKKANQKGIIAKVFDFFWAW